VMIILASHFITNAELIEFQLSVAEANDKPVVAIRPFGGIVDTPQELMNRVKEHITWNTREIADALKLKARLEDTARWEVVDFP